MMIRKAMETDIPGMLALLQQVGQVHHDIRPDIFRSGCQKYDAAALSRLLEDPTRPIFIADMDGEVAGYCFCIHKDFQGDPVMTDRRELYIDDLCVDEVRRGSGIATKLFSHVRSYAAEHGYTAITLNVWCGNASAMKFYEKMGMSPRSITMDLPCEE